MTITHSPEWEPTPVTFTVAAPLAVILYFFYKFKAMKIKKNKLSQPSPKLTQTQDQHSRGQNSKPIKHLIGLIT